MANNDLRNIGAWVSTGNPQTVNDAPSTAFAAGQLGSYTVTMDGLAIPSGTVDLPTGTFPRVWQYVTLSATSATPAFGQVVGWVTATGSAFTVSTGITVSRNRPAGIVTSSAVTLGNYIWILVSGVGPGLNEAGTTPADGDALRVGATTAGRIDFTANGTATASLCIGTALGTKTTAFGGSSALPTDTIAALYNFPRFGSL
jgi:hypothetical protein